MWTWNDFLWPLITIYSPNNMTIQLGLATFQGAHQTNTNLLMAANVMSMIPVLLLFFFAQRYFIRGIATTGAQGVASGRRSRWTHVTKRFSKSVAARGRPHARRSATASS